MKLQMMAAFGAGYVLGARAGRERYQEIKDTAARIQDDPRVKEAAAKAETVVRETASRVQDDPRVKSATATAGEKAKAAATTAQDKVKGASGTVSKKSGRTTANDDADRPVSVPDASVPPLAEGQLPDTPSVTSDDDSVAVEDEVVFSTGPDVEKSVDELAPNPDDDRI